YLEEALAIQRKALPSQHPDLAINLNNLGVLLQDLGQRDQARRYYEEALAIKRKGLPAQHPTLAISLNNLAVLLLDLRQQQEGGPLFHEAAASWAGYTAAVAAGSAERDHAPLAAQGRFHLDAFLNLAAQHPPPSAAQRQQVLAAVLDARA